MYSMSRTQRLQIRISPELKKKVELIAKERNVSVSELIVDYIKRLPNVTYSQHRPETGTCGLLIHSC
ncbi:ribbon-helix-helix protein, CopG family [Chroococcidiopsis sp. CCMEE 29]|uniref:ribbon-helix-helix protein, CopG family n=1 Tax=Chroococcidiopsis sp. CCMEE 29 TaxID=155894 RepID=UPI0031F889E0